MMLDSPVRAETPNLLKALLCARGWGPLPLTLLPTSMVDTASTANSATKGESETKSWGHCSNPKGQANICPLTHVFSPLSHFVSVGRSVIPCTLCCPHRPAFLHGYSWQTHNANEG